MPVPVTVKVYGFSSLSLFDIKIVIDFAPISAGLNEIVKVVENPAGTGVFVEFWSIVNKDTSPPFLMILLAVKTTDIVSGGAWG